MIRTPAHKQTDPNKAPGMVRDNKENYTVPTFKEYYYGGKKVWDKYNFSKEQVRRMYFEFFLPHIDPK